MLYEQCGSYDFEKVDGFRGMKEMILKMFWKSCIFILLCFTSLSLCSYVSVFFLPFSFSISDNKKGSVRKYVHFPQNGCQ